MHTHKRAHTCTHPHKHTQCHARKCIMPTHGEPIQALSRERSQHRKERQTKHFGVYQVQTLSYWFPNTTLSARLSVPKAPLKPLSQKMHRLLARVPEAQGHGAASVTPTTQTGPWTTHRARA